MVQSVASDFRKIAQVLRHFSAPKREGSNSIHTKVCFTHFIAHSFPFRGFIVLTTPLGITPLYFVETPKLVVPRRSTPRCGDPALLSEPTAPRRCAHGRNYVPHRRQLLTEGKDPSQRRIRSSLDLDQDPFGRGEMGQGRGEEMESNG